MKLKNNSWLIFCLVVIGFDAQAGEYTCSLGAFTGISLNYVPTATSPTTGTGTVNVICSKNGGNNDTIYYELGVDGFDNPGGSNNWLWNGTNKISYTIWRNAANNQAWNNATANRFIKTVSGASTQTITENYYINIPAGQVIPAGTYSDTPVLKLYQGETAANASATSSFTSQGFTLSASVLEQCSLSTPPGNVLFSYTSFQTSAASASTSFAVTCGSGLVYTMALDASSGTLLALNYSLSLSQIGSQTGIGSPQPYTINGKMAAGQSGTCSTGSCTASDPRVLTISY